MKIFTEGDYEHMSMMAANVVAPYICSGMTIGLATGSTPIGLYGELVKKCRANKIDFSRIKTINLDEYVGLDKDSKQSYRYFMDSFLFDLVNIDKRNTFIPNGNGDLDKECKRYDELIERYPIDLQILGIGHNGHIGFNEPSDSFSKNTHVVELTKSTMDANSRFFTGEKMPEKAITMGIAQIFSAKSIILLVNGESKADIIREALLGPITPRVPASILQLHEDLTVIGDMAALKYV